VVVDSKFDSSRGEWYSNEPLRAYGVDLCKNIRSRGKFSSHIRFEVGDESKVRFWHYLWCGDMALKEAFSFIYGIACTKDVYVATHIENMSFARAVYNWEVNVFAAFFTVG
jgi:hypothetical protein